MRMPIDPGRVRPTSGDRLKPNDIDRIVAELKSWSKPKVTWNVVVAAVADRLKPRRFSRQALQDKPEIYRAYAKAKERARNGLPPEKRKPLGKRIAVLEDENRRLRAENESMLEMFVTWMLNATDHRVSVELLEKPFQPAQLPSDYREAEVKRKEVERAEGLAKLKRLVARKAEKRLAL
jgi:hypothetical protein